MFTGYAILMIVGLVIAVLWIFLPFAVFGLKDLVREVLAETRRTNELLKQINDRQAAPKLTDRV